MFSRNFLGNSKRIATLVIIIVLILWSNAPLSQGSDRTWSVLPPTAHLAPSVALSTLNITEWGVPSGSAGPWGIGVDQFGKVWFTENQTGKLAKLDPASNKVYDWDIPGGSGSLRFPYVFLKPVSISGSLSTRVYFTEYNTHKIGYFDNNTNQRDTFYEWTLPDGNSKPVGIYVDENNDIWFTESGRDIIGRLTPGGPGAWINQLTEWALPHPSCSGRGPSSSCLNPWAISVRVNPTFSGSNRFVWFTTLTNNTIGRLEAGSSRLTLFNLGALGLGDLQPMDLTVDAGSNAIFSNVNRDRISILSNNSAYRDYNLPTSASKATSVALDSSRSAVWFTGFNAGNVGFANSTFTSATTTFLASTTCTIPSPPVPVPRPASVCPDPSVIARNNNIGDPSINGRGANTNTENPSSSTLSVFNSFNGVTEYRLSSTVSRPNSVAVDPSGKVWFTEWDSSANKIASLSIPLIFQVSATPTPQTINQGQSASYTVTVSLTSGSPSSVSLSINTPAGLSANFNPQSQPPPFTSTLTIGTTTATQVGSYAMTITAKAGSFSQTFPITLNVQSQVITTTTAAPFDFQVSVVGGAGGDKVTVLEGNSASFNLQVSLVSGNPDFVSLSAAGPPGASLKFTDSNDLPTFTSTLNVKTSIGIAAGPHPINITGTSGAKTRPLQVTLTVTALPRDFNVTASTYAFQQTQASQRSIDLTVQSVGVFDGTVTFTGTVTPSSGVTVSFSQTGIAPPRGGTATLQMLVVAPRNVPTGEYKILVTAASGSLSSKQLTITVTVTGCLIATATYGSEVAPEVQFLRDFRDFQITKTFAGSNFMTAFNAWYYSFSPAVAQYEYAHSTIRMAMKFVLYPLIGVLHVSSASYSLLAFQPELAALVAGMVASSLIGVVYLALPFSGVLWLARRRLQNRTGRRVAKWFMGLLIMLIAGFMVSEILAAPVAMMVVSAATVLTVLMMGGILPALRIVKFAKR